MEINQSSSTLSITSNVVGGYSNVYILQKIDPTTEIPTNIDYKISTGSTSFTLTTDGYYLIYKFILSTTPAETYYIDGETVHTSGDETLTGEALYDLLDIEDYDAENITVEDIEHFTYYFVETYYINLLKSKFLKSLCSCGCIDQKDRVTIDTLTMGIEVIKSLITYSQLNEAARIVSLLSTCAGLTTTSCNCYG